MSWDTDLENSKLYQFEVLIVLNQVTGRAANIKGIDRQANKVLWSDYGGNNSKDYPIKEEDNEVRKYIHRL